MTTVAHPAAPQRTAPPEMTKATHPHTLSSPPTGTNPPLGEIDRASPLPMYYQLKQNLLSFIGRQKMVPGDRLPGDHDLCRMSGVSRTVVRQALTELEYEGVITRVKGRGTFVAGGKTSEGLVQSLVGLAEDVRARGGQLRSVVRRSTVTLADDTVAADLCIPVGSQVVELERLRLIDEEPWSLTISQLPYEIGKGLLTEDLTATSLYTILEQRYGVHIARGRRSVEAMNAPAEVAHALKVPVSAAILVLHSVSYSPLNTPVERFVAFHRGDRSRFQVDLTRDGAPGSIGITVHPTTTAHSTGV